MVYLDGHEVAMVSTISGALWLTHRSLPQNWIRGFVHRQPVAAMSVFWGLTGMALPLVIPPLRRSLGMATNQYDADHPRATFPKYAQP